MFVFVENSKCVTKEDKRECVDPQEVTVLQKILDLLKKLSNVQFFNYFKEL